MPSLTVELVPRTAWFKNARTLIPRPLWDKHRRATYRAAGYVCECCGGVGPKHPVECHERWEYDDEKHTQTLVGLIALCPACHEVKHIGRAQAIGNGERALKHLMKVNGWRRESAERYIEKAFKKWSERSEFEWTTDWQWLCD